MRDFWVEAGGLWLIVITPGITESEIYANTARLAQSKFKEAEPRTSAHPPLLQHQHPLVLGDTGNRHHSRPGQVGNLRRMPFAVVDGLLTQSASGIRGVDTYLIVPSDKYHVVSEGID
jgi:hypothetical protein